MVPSRSLLVQFRTLLKGTLLLAIILPLLSSGVQRVTYLGTVTTTSTFFIFFFAVDCSFVRSETVCARRGSLSTGNDTLLLPTPICKIPIVFFFRFDRSELRVSSTKGAPNPVVGRTNAINRIYCQDIYWNEKERALIFLESRNEANKYITCDFWKKWRRKRLE